jgi:hypothetical protein
LGGTSNVEGTITLGSNAEIVAGYNDDYPAYTIVIKNGGSITGGGASNFYDENGAPITEPIPAGTYVWTNDINGDGTTGDSGWKATP